MNASLVALVLGVALLAGCSSPETVPTTDATTTWTSTKASAPPGWTKDPCDERRPDFSGNARPQTLFQRMSANSAELLAAHVVEALGDRLDAKTDAAQAEGQNDAQAWQTRNGFITVYWARDPTAWSAEYASTVTNPETDETKSRNASAHAILGSLGIPDQEVEWSSGPEWLQASRMVGGASMPLVRVSDQEMQAEQAHLLRRTVKVDPDYTFHAGAPLGSAAAREAAQGVLDCSAEGGGVALRLNSTSTVTVFHSTLAYWFLVEPQLGWEATCGFERQGALHIGLDAVTGTVLSKEVACARPA